MNVKKIDTAALGRWVDQLIAQTRVVGVKAKGDHFVFAPLARAAELRLDYDVTLLPPKKYFMPPVEELLAYDGAGRYAGVKPPEPFVLFGVHPYDMAAIGQMDVFFLSGQKDAHYAERRAAATLVVCDVEKASKNAFAASLGTAVVHEGFDVLLTRISQDHYLADARTAKGEKLAAALRDAPAAKAEELAARQGVWDKNKKPLNQQVLKMTPAELPGLLAKADDHPVWEEMSKKCFSCGSCNMVCPTCYCFDVQDDTPWNLEGGRRCRLWDGCLLKEFTLVAGGHHFRKDRKSRYRHRYLRKGKYMWDKFGHISCVGCGRCVSACVPNIANPVEVYNRIMEG